MNKKTFLENILLFYVGAKFLMTYVFRLEASGDYVPLVVALIVFLGVLGMIGYSSLQNKRKLRLIISILMLVYSFLSNLVDLFAIMRLRLYMERVDLILSRSFESFIEVVFYITLIAYFTSAYRESYVNSK